MVSDALQEWQTTRSRRVQQLLDAHAAMSPPGPGRRWRTEQVNWALILRLAAEFQGFSRALHDQTAAFFGTSVAATNPAIGTVLLFVTTHNRRLNKGNADASCLSEDFSRFGMQLWKELDRAYPAESSGWNKAVQTLNLARNGIAHDDRAKIAQAETQGWPLNRLSTFKRLRAELDGLTLALDFAVGTYLHRLVGGAPPW